MNKACPLAIFLSFLFIIAQGTPGDTVIVKKKYFTKKLTGAVTLDGIPNEEAWNAVEWGGDFIQWSPNEGKPPSQQTNFKIIYDDKFLYIAYRCHDLAADSIVKRMGRRDEFPGDWIEI
ncbi:MAG: hydrolase, partial [Bacteroidetes bacterium]